MRPKICFVLPSLNGGGAERAAVQILNGLDPTRWDRSMFLFAREGPYLADVDRSIPIASANAASRLGRWRHLRAFLAGERPAIVMAFLSFYSVLTAARAANAGARVLFNLQTPMSAFLTDADYQWRHGLQKAVFAAVTRVGYAAADGIVATSQGVAADLTRAFAIDPSRIRVLPNPVDLDRVAAGSAEPVDAGVVPTGDGPLIVAAGRLADAKNYPLMIDAFAELRRRRPARLCILGQGDLERSLRQLIAARGLGDAVTLAGFQSNPWKYVAQADLFLLTSHYEGFGNVLIEAMACGVPVVATASAGTRDIVQHGSNGMLVESHTPAAVADALDKILGNPALLQRLRVGARTSTTTYGLPATVARYDAMMGEVLA